MLRQRKQARLIEAPQDDFALGHLGLVAEMMVQHRRGKNAHLPQRSYELVLGHRRGSFWLANPLALCLCWSRPSPTESLADGGVNNLPEFLLQRPCVHREVDFVYVRSQRP